VDPVPVENGTIAELIYEVTRCEKDQYRDHILPKGENNVENTSHQLRGGFAHLCMDWQGP